MAQSPGLTFPLSRAPNTSGPRHWELNTPSLPFPDLLGYLETPLGIFPGPGLLPLIQGTVPSLWVCSSSRTVQRSPTFWTSRTISEVTVTSKSDPPGASPFWVFLDIPPSPTRAGNSDLVFGKLSSHRVVPVTPAGPTSFETPLPVPLRPIHRFPPGFPGVDSLLQLNS